VAATKGTNRGREFREGDTLRPRREATYKDGILEVRVPVDRTNAEAHKIPVQRT
jgi:HSP20 family molecular chaperone IbpA